MNQMQLIICETTGDWAAALWQWLPASVSLIETRSLGEMWERLHSAPAAMVALELTTERAESLLAALVQLDREFPQSVALVLAERNLAGWEEIVRQAGAVHFIVSPRRLDEVVELVRRAASAIANQLPSGNESVNLEDQILANLPWGD
jgi:DNA-binding NtrC family response regulator